MFLVGIVLAAVGMVGRIWCLTYSSGYKSSELVTQGPYSVCRNPLYFFSFIGLVGIGLATETVSLTLFLVAFFALVPSCHHRGRRIPARQVWPTVAYCRLTPRFFPRRSLFVEPESYGAAAAPVARRGHLVHRTAGRDPGAGALRTAGVLGNAAMLP
jgi:hypothetical protein